MAVVQRCRAVSLLLFVFVALMAAPVETQSATKKPAAGQPKPRTRRSPPAPPPAEVAGQQEDESNLITGSVVFIGPVRIKLVNGKTIDGMGVIKSPDNVRLIMQDGTQIDFDPITVASVVSLTVNEEASSAGTATRAVEQPPVKAPQTGKVVKGPEKRKSEADSGKPSAKATPKPPAKEAAGGKAPTGSAVNPLSPKPPSKPDAAVSGGAGNTGKNRPELKAGEKGASSTEGDSTQEQSTAAVVVSGVLAEAASIEPEGPKPEELDATVPVAQPGIRVLGGPPIPSSQVDFPKPSKPVLSFGASIWRPKEGFRFASRWPPPLPPTTSFPNALSGWGKPVTSFGPTFSKFHPPIRATSIAPTYWAPSDGFAKSEPQSQ